MMMRPRFFFLLPNSKKKKKIKNYVRRKPPSLQKKHWVSFLWLNILYSCEKDLDSLGRRERERECVCVCVSERGERERLNLKINFSFFFFFSLSSFFYFFKKKNPADEEVRFSMFDGDNKYELLEKNQRVPREELEPKLELSDQKLNGAKLVFFFKEYREIFPIPVRGMMHSQTKRVDI